MEDYIRHGELIIKCNIQIDQIHRLSIGESVNCHASAEVTVSIEHDSLEVSCEEMDSQPIMIYSVKGKKELLLFSGVISRVEIAKKARYDVLFISAYSISWFMDLERKSRSFQNCGDTILGLVQKIVKEHDFSAICSDIDAPVSKPFIQYQETDWEFILRLSTHLHMPLICAADYNGRGIYLGFQDGRQPLELSAMSETWSMNAEHVKFDNWGTRDAAYYEVITSQVLHLGQCVNYRNEILWPYQVRMYLEQGVLRCAYVLSGKRYYNNPVAFNPYLKGISLTGGVLERKDESIKIHLDIDEEQDAANAFYYPWFPENGNLVYCMPEIGSRIHLLIPSEDERDAIGINCVRLNGQSCEETQNTDGRWFSTVDEKKMTLQLSSLELTADKDQSGISLQDSVGPVISSNKELLIQAKGKVMLQGTRVELKAPKEITAVKRQLGSPTVVNVCHNMDALGGHSTFENLPPIKMQNVSGNTRSYQGGPSKSGDPKQEQEKIEREKLQFKLKELLDEDDERSNYELDSAIVKIISSIPQEIDQNPLSRIAAGFRPITGRMREE